MYPLLLDVVTIGQDGSMEDVETLPAVIRGNYIYVHLSEGIFFIKKVLTGRDHHSGPITLNGVELKTRITSMAPGFNAFHPVSEEQKDMEAVNQTFKEAFGWKQIPLCTFCREGFIMQRLNFILNFHLIEDFLIQHLVPVY